MSQLIHSPLHALPPISAHAANRFSELKNYRLRLRAFLAALSVGVIGVSAMLAPALVNAQMLLTTISTGVGPTSAVLNPVTNRLYVANSTSNSLTVIDGAKNVTIATVAMGTTPRGIAVNSASNKIYVANALSADIKVVDGVTNTVIATILHPSQTGTEAIALNPATNRIYVVSQGASGGNGSIAVIDGATNTVLSTVVVGSRPRALSVNASTNRIYVANGNGHTVSVINGATNEVTNTIATGLFPNIIALNPVTNKVYVGSSESNNFTLIDGATNVATAIQIAPISDVNTRTAALAVNPISNKIYAALAAPNKIISIDGVNDGVTSGALSGTPSTMAIDTDINVLYVGNGAANTVSFLDGATLNVLDTDAVANNPQAISVNMLTKKVYVANTGGNNVSVLDSRFTGAVEQLTVGHDPSPLALNLSTNTIFAANSSFNTVTILNGSTKASQTIAVGLQPSGVALNPSTSRAYVSNAGSGTVSVIDTSAGIIVGTVVVGTEPTAIAVNTATNRTYVANSGSGSVAVIDGASNSRIATVNTGIRPNKIAINAATNQIYVANESSRTISVIDGASNSIAATIPLVSAVAKIVVNSATNIAYAALSNGELIAISGVTFAITGRTTVGASRINLALNRFTNRVYFSRDASNSGGTITVLDGASLNVLDVIATLNLDSLSVDEVENRIYGASFLSNSIVSIDGVNNKVMTSPVGVAVDATVNPLDGKIYAATLGQNGIRAVAIRKSVVNPLTTIISGTNFVSGLSSAVRSANPTFSLAASSTYAPQAQTVRTIYYQLDTKTGPWTQVMGTSAFTASLTNVARGEHVLFAYAVDSLAGGATSGNTWSGPGITPLVGSVTALPFTVLEPLAQVITGFTPPASVTFGAVALTLSAAGGASGNPVVFATTSSATVCTVIGNLVTFAGVGTCNLTSNQAGSSEFANAPQVVAAIIIAPVVPIITFAPLPTSVRVGSQNGLAATSSAGLPVSVTTSDAAVCSVSIFPPTSGTPCAVPGATCAPVVVLVPKMVGVCVVSASSPAQGNFASAAPVVQTIAVTKGAQTISGLIVPPTLVGGTSALISATGGATGNSITFSTTSTAAICTVVGATLNAVGAGTCAVTANQAGNSNYDAATAVTANVTITPAPKVTPDAFSFPDRVNVPLNSAVTSNTVTVSGIDVALPVSITGSAGSNAAYSIGCTATFTTGASTITNGQQICVRVTSGINSGEARIATLLVGAASARFYTITADSAAQNRYRIFIPSTGGHLYTTDKNEYDFLIKSPAVYLDEGIDHKIFTQPVTKNGQTAKPYYRLYIIGARQHFWTSDLNEYTILRAQTTAISDDGIDGYLFLNAGVTGSVPLYRLVLTNTAIHHWTIDKNEFDFLVRSGEWLPEGNAGNPAGVAGYVIPK